MAEALAEYSDSLTLVTSGAFTGRQKSRTQIQQWYGVKSTFHIRKLPIFRRFPEALIPWIRSRRFDRAAALYARFLSPDLVYTRSPHAAFLCAAMRIRTILETHIQTDHAEFDHVVQALARPAGVGLVTISEVLAEDYRASGIRESKICVWPDAVNIGDYTELPGRDALRQECHLPRDRLVVTYCGHLYDYKGVPAVIEAARSLPDALFLIVGGWPLDVERCSHMADGLENVRFEGFVPGGRVPRYLRASDILLLPHTLNHVQARVTSPLKLFEYMAARRPIVASDIPAFQGILRDRENCLLVRPDDPRVIVQAVQELAANHSLGRSISDGGWNDVQQLTWSRRAGSILQCFGIIGNASKT